MFKRCRLSFLACLLLLGSAAAASAAENDKMTAMLQSPIAIGAKPARTLHFPADHSLGELLIAPNPYDPKLTRSGMMVGAARGDVKVAANRIVVFTPAHRFYENPAVIKSLDRDSIDGLRVSASSMDDAEDGLCNRALAQIGHLRGLVWLNLDRSDANDEAIAHAAELPQLQKLSAFSTMLKGDCLKRISTLKKLNTMHLSYNNIKQENLAYLPALPELQYLHLGRTALTDKGMQSVGRCARLECLDVSQNVITDASIKDILALKRLKLLLCKGTNITPEGIVKLRALPQLQAVILPAGRYRQKDLDYMKNAMPRVNLICAGGGTTDQETKVLYAPLH